MIFIAATGKIDPLSIKFDGVTMGTCVLQVSADRYRVALRGLEHCKLIAGLLPGENIFILGSADNKKRFTVRPRLILRVNELDGDAQIVLDAAKQIIEAHFWNRK